MNNIIILYIGLCFTLCLFVVSSPISFTTLFNNILLINLLVPFICFILLIKTITIFFSKEKLNNLLFKHILLINILLNKYLTD